MRENRENNFGFLRLLFAMLVIVSHSPEIIDGSRANEILIKIFGTLSLGDISVDGFFLISGYLVTKSYIRSESTYFYFCKRILRIVPGYFVCFLICVVFIAPFVSASAFAVVLDLPREALLMLRLRAPESPNAFFGLPIQELNQSMWTISYEFRCYIIVAVLGLLGAYRWKWAILVVALTGMILSIVGFASRFHEGNVVIGQPESALRFFFIFQIGALFYLFRDRIRYTAGGAILAVVFLIPLLFSNVFAEPAVAVMGGYLIFCFAFKFPVLAISKACNETDISYGVYLYAWPIQSLIVWSSGLMNPWILSAISIGAATVAGHLSWRLIERPAMNLYDRRVALAASSTPTN
jgi:peptidoglycan/LPS O-acetylase OafA/YrhL